MKKLSTLNRMLLLLTGLLAAYQVGVGIDGVITLPAIGYTLAFGVLLVAGLLLIILGFEILESSLIVIIATLIPLSLSLGLVSNFFPSYGPAYLVFGLLGLALIAITKVFAPGGVATLALVLVHGVAGLVIFLLPLILAILRDVPAGFALVGVGGGLIGVGGLLLSFLRMGKTILSRERILSLLPGLLLLMTASFVGGFMFV